mmetsp:Transcript_45911/g.69251  ORF Transcript_45911/g.69251 Transcript_45911/m.69251 type:complete len:373 (+) Transcript_45911:224-1342(+)
MHLTSDGLRVCVGKLSCQTSNFGNSHKTVQKTKFESLVEEAFYRAPNHTLQTAAAPTSSSLLNMNVSLTASAMPGMIPSSVSSTSNTVGNTSFSTTFGSKSVQTLPLYGSSCGRVASMNSCDDVAGGRIKISYKPLSSLLRSKHKLHLQVYKKLERVINSVKRKTPKITLYIHFLKDPTDAGQQSCKAKGGAYVERKPSLTSVDKRPVLLGGLMAKTMVMENSPLPDVETIFVDGMTIRYQMISGSAELILPKEQGNVSYAIDLSVTEGTKTSNNSLANNSFRMKKTVAPPKCSSSKHSCPVENDFIKRRFANHISFAQTATEECLRMERLFESAPATRRYTSSSNNEDIFPVIRKIIARGTCRKDWIAVDY